MTRILVVDDDRNTLLLYQRELADEGYEITTAAGAREALESFRADRPNLVVLDVRMPIMDGLEVLGRMLAIDRRVPIILCSAHLFYRDNFLSWSADVFVAKSSDLTELKTAVKDRLQKFAACREAVSGMPSNPPLLDQRRTLGARPLEQ